jgi:hypothetical protein
VSARARPIAFTVGPPRGKRAAVVQAVGFDRSAWKRHEVVAWLKRHKFKSAPLEALRGSYRATQRPARDFTRLRIIATTGHPQPLKNPTREPYDVEELTRDPREQGFRDAKAGKPSHPPGWYTPTERGHYAEGYIAGGQGRKGRPAPPSRLKKNPRIGKLVVPAKEYRQAIQLYQKFREAPPRKVGTMQLQMPRMLVRIGPIPWLYYLTTHRDGKEILYKHTFAKHARPILCASHNGRSLYLVGGRYDFTGDGIVDRPR